MNWSRGTGQRVLHRDPGGGPRGFSRALMSIGLTRAVTHALCRLSKFRLFLKSPRAGLGTPTWWLRLRIFWRYPLTGVASSRCVSSGGQNRRGSGKRVRPIFERAYRGRDGAPETWHGSGFFSGRADRSPQNVCVPQGRQARSRWKTARHQMNDW